MSQGVEECVAQAQAKYEAENEGAGLRHIPCEAKVLWCKLNHLLYLPILGLTRPRDLYYYQGDGWRCLYGFTYKYLTLEHFLGQMTRIQVGFPLANTLAYAYTQAWYPGQRPLYLFADWHVKPHWTKAYAHAGHVTMWGRTMPGTKQLMLNGPQGHFVGGWSYPIDTHLTHVLVDLEEELSQTLQRPITCTIVDGEAGGQPIGERYAQAQRCYISVLSHQHDHCLAEFALQGAWCPVVDDPSREAVLARWSNPRKAIQDPRQLVLLRPVGQTQPTRIYTGLIPDEMPAALIPWLHRRRWPNNELRIRELVNGANLNANYGYTYTEVPHRTRQREWDKAQAKVMVTQRLLSQHQDALHNLRHQLRQLQHHFSQQRTDLQARIVKQRYELDQRQLLGKPLQRCRNRLQRLRKELADGQLRFQKPQRRLLFALRQHQTHSCRLRRQLIERSAARDAIDTATLCRQRHLQKDQIMLNLQILLGNLHDWVKQHYFAPALKNT